MTSSVSFLVTAGTTYRIAVDGSGGQMGSLTLNWNLQVPTPPPNDNFSNATVLSGSTRLITGTNVDATKESGEPSHAGNAGGASVWYTWQATTAGSVTIDTIGSDFDTLLAVYTGTAVNTLTSIASNDDLDGGDLDSRVTFNAVAGTTYRVAVDGYNARSGAIKLKWAQGSSGSSQSGGSGLTPEELRLLEQERIAALQIQAEKTGGEGSSLDGEEPCVEGPPEPNRGQATLIDGATEAFLLLAQDSAQAPAPGELSIQHSIITTNTPRARDLYGKLRLKVVSGDPQIIGRQTAGNGYLQDTLRDVVEEGHEGCGVHDWHTGIESYKFTPVKPGKLVLKAEVDPNPDDGGDGPAVLSEAFTLYVVKFEQKKPLWWFAGVDARGYEEVVTITARGLEDYSGALNWSVSEGSDKVEATGRTVTGSFGLGSRPNAFEIKSVGRSVSQNDVQITLQCGDRDLTHQLTVYAPIGCSVRGPFDSPSFGGFRTLYYILVRDQFDTPLPKSIDVNEDLQQWINDFDFANTPGSAQWPRPGPVGGTAYPEFQDSYKQQSTRFPPHPVNPGDDKDSVEIDHCEQVYRAGSKSIGRGIEFKRHTLQRYRGKARQE